MEELVEQIKEILEIDELDVNKKFTDYESWDSLCSLSIIALVDSDYHQTLSNKDILAFNSIKEFCEAVLN